MKERHSIKTNPFKQILRFKLGVVLFMMCSAFLQSDEPVSFRFYNLSLDEALVKAADDNKNVFVEVIADWCGQCKRFERETLNRAEIDSIYHQEYISIRVNGEDGGDGKICILRYKVTAYPTLLYLSPNGRLLGKYVGVRSINQLMDYAAIH